MENKSSKDMNLEKENGISEKLSSLCKRQLRLETLNKEIKEETDKEQYLRKLEIGYELSAIQTRELLDYINERAKSTTELIDEANLVISECRNLNLELCDALEQERRENKEFYDEFYDNLCYCMLTNPRGTFEMLLGQVERNEKLKDTSGGSWEWTFKFPLLARLRMAFKLTFG